MRRKNKRRLDVNKENQWVKTKIIRLGKFELKNRNIV